MAQPSSSNGDSSQHQATDTKDLESREAALSAREKVLYAQAAALQQGQRQLQLQVQQQQQLLAARETRVAASEAELQKRHGALALERQAMAKDLQVVQQHANQLQQLQQAMEQRYAVIMQLARQITSLVKGQTAPALTTHTLQQPAVSTAQSLLQATSTPLASILSQALSQGLGNMTGIGGQPLPDMSQVPSVLSNSVLGGGVGVGFGIGGTDVGSMMLDVWRDLPLAGALSSAGPLIPSLGPSPLIGPTGGAAANPDGSGPQVTAINSGAAAPIPAHSTHAPDQTTHILPDHARPVVEVPPSATGVHSTSLSRHVPAQPPFHGLQQAPVSVVAQPPALPQPASSNVHHHDKSENLPIAVVPSPLPSPGLSRDQGPAGAAGVMSVLSQARPGPQRNMTDPVPPPNAQPHAPPAGVFTAPVGSGLDPGAGMEFTADRLVRGGRGVDTGGERSGGGAASDDVQDLKYERDGGRPYKKSKTSHHDEGPGPDKGQNARAPFAHDRRVRHDRLDGSWGPDSGGADRAHAGGPGDRNRSRGPSHGGKDASRECARGQGNIQAVAATTGKKKKGKKSRSRDSSLPPRGQQPRDSAEKGVDRHQTRVGKGADGTGTPSRGEPSLGGAPGRQHVLTEDGQPALQQQAVQQQVLHQQHVVQSATPEVGQAAAIQPVQGAGVAPGVDVAKEDLAAGMSDTAAVPQGGTTAWLPMPGVPGTSPPGPAELVSPTHSSVLQSPPPSGHPGAHEQHAPAESDKQDTGGTRHDLLPTEGLDPAVQGGTGRQYCHPSDHSRNQGNDWRQNGPHGSGRPSATPWMDEPWTQDHTGPQRPYHGSSREREALPRHLSGPQRACYGDSGSREAPHPHADRRGPHYGNNGSWKGRPHPQAGAQGPYHGNNFREGGPAYQRIPPSRLTWQRSPPASRHDAPTEGWPPGNPLRHPADQRMERGPYSQHEPLRQHHPAHSGPNSEGGAAQSGGVGADSDSKGPRFVAGPHGDVPSDPRPAAQRGSAAHDRPQPAQDGSAASTSAQGTRPLRMQPRAVPRANNAGDRNGAGSSARDAQAGTAARRFVKGFMPNLMRRRRGLVNHNSSAPAASDDGIEQMVALLQQDAAEEEAEATDGQ